jgi:hypothetical protein
MRLRRRPLHRALLLIGGGLLTATGQVAGQDRAVVRAEENFRREPNGVLLAELDPGTSLRVLGTEGNWTQVELEGWVWLRSLQSSEDPAFALVVSASGGENLRSGPSGTILGRLAEGALLEELGRDEAWARVSRVGWIWSASVSTDAAPAATPPGERPVAPPASTGPSARVPGGFQRAGAAGASILAAPDGDTLAVAAPSSDLQIVRREGNWARVRLEGWVWLPVGDEADEEAPTEAPTALEPAVLRDSPEAYAGRVVAWSVQFISLERAESVRTDFFEGEPFLLTRFGGGDGPFVYVAVPNDRLPEVEGLLPLERIEVTGRVRTGASSLTGAPIIELISLARSR